MRNMVGVNTHKAIPTCMVVGCGQVAIYRSPFVRPGLRGYCDDHKSLAMTGRTGTKGPRKEASIMRFLDRRERQCWPDESVEALDLFALREVVLMLVGTVRLTSPVPYEGLGVICSSGHGPSVETLQSREAFRRQQRDARLRAHRREEQMKRHHQHLHRQPVPDHPPLPVPFCDRCGGSLVEISGVQDVRDAATGRWIHFLACPSCHCWIHHYI